jgi:hypothetical protein
MKLLIEYRVQAPVTSSSLGLKVLLNTLFQTLSLYEEFHLLGYNAV